MWAGPLDSYGRPMLLQTTIWDDLVGEAWVRHGGVIDAHNRDFGNAVLSALEPVDGASILDVGCGNGASALELARRGAGEVLGVDLSASMVECARARAEAGGFDNVSFELTDVLRLDRPGEFDVVHSRDGVMFFDDAVAGFAHLRRLTRPGARLGFTAWAGPEGNPWMTVPMLASIPVVGPPDLPGPGEPGAFSLATEERIEQVLTGAGWHDLTITELSLERPHPAGDAEAFAAVAVEISPPLAAGLARVPDRADDLRAAIAEAVRPYERAGAVHLRATAHIVTAVA